MLLLLGVMVVLMVVVWFCVQVPRVCEKLAQLVCPDTLLLALQFAREVDNPYFRLCYNSLGAYGTINHLHYQVGAAWEWSRNLPVGWGRCGG